MHDNNKDAWDEKKGQSLINQATAPNLSIRIRIQTEKKVANNDNNEQTKWSKKKSVAFAYG